MVEARGQRPHDRPDGTSYSRSVCLEPMEYNADGTIRKIHPSTESIFGK